MHPPPPIRRGRAPRPATPLKRRCEVSFQRAVVELHRACRDLEGGRADDLEASRWALRQIVDQTRRQAARLIDEARGHGLGVPPRVRSLLGECSALARRANQAILGAETAARQARFQADLLADEHLTSSWEASPTEAGRSPSPRAPT